MLELKYKDNLINKTYSTPLLTDYSFENGFKDGNRAIIL